MSKYGLRFEDKSEDCVSQMKTHHIFLTEDEEKSFVRDVKKHHNLLIKGENYHALKMLQWTHKGKVDVIYIDPPYNTGNKDFVYNDDFVDEEDSFRHSKWLSFMARRLEIAYKLLSDKGVIFISIDDNELFQLKMLCDQIFGENSYVCNFTWQTKQGAKGVPPSNMLIMNTEYILCYCKSNKFRFNGDTRTDDGFANPDNDPRGLWRSENIRATGKQNNYFDIVDPKTGISYNGNWAFCKKTIEQMIADDKILFPKTKKGDGTPRQKKFKDSYTNDTKAITTALGWYSTQESTESLAEVFGGEKLFDTPKPLPLIKYLLQQASQKDSIILDFFAGSGTTGQAVAELNKEDGGSRQFILCTNNARSEKLSDGICEEVTYPRLAKTIDNENLKYMVVSSLPKEGKKSDHIFQLVDDNKIAPLLMVKYNAFNEVEKTEKYTILSNNNDFCLAIWNDYIEPEEKSFRQKLDSICKNNVIEICVDSEYPRDYYEFINRKDEKEK